MTIEQNIGLQELVNEMLRTKKAWKLSRDGAERGKAHDVFFRAREKLFDYLNQLE